MSGSSTKAWDCRAGAGADGDDPLRLLQPEWPAIFDAAEKAEAAVHADPRTACFCARRALDLAVAWDYKHDATLELTYHGNLTIWFKKL